MIATTDKPLGYRIRVKIGDKELEVEGDKDFVTETCLNLHAQLLKVPSIPELEQSLILLDNDNDATIEIGENEAKSTIKPDRQNRVSLASFLRKTKANTNLDYALVIAAYLYQYRDVEEFNKNDIEQCYREALLKKSSNVSRDINANRTKGYFDLSAEKDGLMSFYITREGLETVENMLSE